MLSKLTRWAVFNTAFIPLMLAVLVLLFMMPFIRPPTGNEVLDGHDLLNQQYPLYSFLFDSVRSGNGLPLWNPYQFAGQSVVGNPQSTIFYPPAWLMVVIGVPRGVGWLVVLHLWWGAYGMATFARQLGASRLGGLAGGIIYAFSGVMSAHLNAGHLNYLMCAAWLPWMAVGYLWGVKRHNWLHASLPGAAAFGMAALTGHPPMLYFGVVWLAVVAVYAVKTRRATWLHTIRTLGAIIVIGGILGAALLLPVGELTLRSNRSEGSLWFSNSFHMPPIQLWSLFVPNLFGEPRAGYWGIPFYEELTAYIGIIPLIAVLVVRRRAATVLLAGFMVVGLMVSLGVAGGLFTLLYYLLPGYSLFRVPSRALYFFMVGGAGLAALLVTELQTVSLGNQLKQLRPAMKWIAVLIVVVMLVDVWRVSAPLVTVSAVDVPDIWKAMSRVVPASPDYRVMTVPNQIVWQAGAAYTRHLNANGYDPLVSEAYQLLLDASDYNPTSPIARLLGVRYLISDRPYEYSGLSGLESLISKTEEGDWTIYEIADPLPRVFIAPSIQVVSDDEAARTLLASGEIDPTETALVNETVNCVGTGTDAADGAMNVQIVSYTPNAIDISTQNRQLGILILTDSYDPNWIVTVDGERTEMLRVYTALRGVCLPPGDHQVRFEFQPRLFYAGVVISTAGWLALAGIGMIVVLRRKRNAIGTG